MKNIINRASCKYLTHKHLSWYGCTFFEVLLLWAVYMVMGLSFVIVLSIILQSKLILFFGFVIFFAISIFLTRMTAPKLGRFKMGRQQNYIFLVLQKQLHQKLSITITFIDREGRWSTRRHVW